MLEDNRYRQGVANCPGALIIHGDGTVAGCTDDDEPDAALGSTRHKGSHKAALIDRNEQLVGDSDGAWRSAATRATAGWATVFEPRSWAIEGATGNRALLEQQRVGAGETVDDACG